MRNLGKIEVLSSNLSGGLPFGAKGLPEAWQLKRGTPVRLIVEWRYWLQHKLLSRSSLEEVPALFKWNSGRVVEGAALEMLLGGLPLRKFESFLFRCRGVLKR